MKILFNPWEGGGGIPCTPRACDGTLRYGSGTNCEKRKNVKILNMYSPLNTHLDIKYMYVSFFNKSMYKPFSQGKVKQKNHRNENLY